ncbi:MAG TPA: hypothetical protein VEJ36_04810 [Nitrososphaerales archaeon]|nr:hypothetical protein [Nitrososphaerales archaeon]
MDFKGRLLKAYSEVEDSLELDAKTKDNPQRALRAIFELNREIGRLANDSPSAALEMKELQLKVNEVTKAVKAGKLAEAKVFLRDARLSIESFVRE